LYSDTTNKLFPPQSGKVDDAINSINLSSAVF